jgi:hypothetical protein
MKKLGFVAALIILSVLLIGCTDFIGMGKSAPTPPANQEIEQMSAIQLGALNSSVVVPPRPELANPPWGITTGMTAPDGTTPWRIFEWGFYPRTHVSNPATINLLNTLSTAYRTGQTFTTNASRDNGVFEPQQSYEYQFVGRRYVRLTVARHSGEPHYAYASGAQVTSTGINAWFIVEPIRWIVANWARLPTHIGTESDYLIVNPLGTGQDNFMNLIALDTLTGGIPFSSRNVLWANSTIRGFLNDTEDGFLGQAFSFDYNFGEQAQLQIRELSVPNNTAAGTVNSVGTGRSTETRDKIWLASHHEIYHDNGMFRSIFPNARSREARPTDWTLANNTWIWSQRPASTWWLRSAHSNFYTYLVGFSGSASVINTDRLIYCIRPAMSVCLATIKEMY